ncbi:hypothetical protein Q8F55_001539 [Vanrija albida]|uniref:Uncharacterized protein n=1 Tax=Vanrija albida TaxID=181172 RepID=A0ABR3QGH3_9TREE
MAPTDAHQPQLNEEETRIVRDAGGWTAFSRSYGLDPTDPEDNDEAYAIVQELAARGGDDDDDDED